MELGPCMVEKTDGAIRYGLVTFGEQFITCKTPVYDNNLTVVSMVSRILFLGSINEITLISPAELYKAVTSPPPRPLHPVPSAVRHPDLDIPPPPPPPRPAVRPIPHDAAGIPIYKNENLDSDVEGGF